MDERLKQKHCSHPGPNQMGFTEYVSMTEGPDDPRQGHELQRAGRLHSQGGKYLIKNDHPYPCNLESLSNCEAREAIRIMTEAKQNNSSFYMHVWFEAPHGPWEIMPNFASWYGGPRLRQDNRMDAYKTMVSAMDESLGRILTALHELDLEEETIVLFTSDNGPENNAGTTAGFKNRKRFLHEGGLRVPAIWQWPGHIAPNTKIADFGIGVDIYPTFLEATGVMKPPTVKVDGMSLLPYLAPSSTSSQYALEKTTVKQARGTIYKSGFAQKNSGRRMQAETIQTRHVPNKPAHRGAHRSDKYGHFAADELLQSEGLHKNVKLPSRILELERRIAMWYTDYEHPRNAAAYTQGFKIITEDSHFPTEVYDLMSDPYEKINILTPEEFKFWSLSLNDSLPLTASRRKKLVALNSTLDKKSRKKIVMQAVLPTLHFFSKYGNAANVLYLKKNYGMDSWHNKENTKLVKSINDAVGKCEIPSVSQVPMLPFEHAEHKFHQVVRPLDYYH